MIIPIITGPTSSGKSSIVYNAGLLTNKVEIISADAFQVYKGLDIGKAKITKQEMQNVPHHLIDILNPDECYSAGMFREHAEKLIEDILNRGKIPVIAGGTGLYIKSLTEGIFDCPEIDENIRKDLQIRLEKQGIEELYNELKKVDIEYAEKISSNDPVRTVRALEVYYGLGITFTQAHKIYNKPPKYSYTVGVLWIDRKKLYENINERTSVMWNMGWVDEVQDLLNKGYNIKCPSFRAIGYKLIADFLMHGGKSHEVINQIAKETRHFAKRQLTWFRHRENVIMYEDKDKLENNLIEIINGHRSRL